MTAKLEPIASPLATSDGRETYAMLNRSQMTTLVRATPDCQSAVLVCLAWHATVQVRMVRGDLAGQEVARVSTKELARITGRPIRTVKHAISVLKEDGVIEMVERRPGRTAVYRLHLSDACQLRIVEQEQA